MRKFRKSALALFLAGAMAFTPVADVLAVSDVDTNISDITVSETEETVPESDTTITETETEDNNTTTDTIESEDETNTDSDTTTKTDSDSETENDGNTESGDDINNNTDSDSETNDDTNSDSEDNIDTDSETDADTDSESEDGADEEADVDSDSDTEDDLDSETENDENSETEHEFPGLKTSSLSSKQIADKKDLKAHLDEIKQQKEGIDYVSGELVFSANTLEEAEKIAAAYGAELKDFAERVGVLILPEGVSVSHALTVAAKSTDVILPPAWPNNIVRAFSESSEITYNDAENIESAADEIYLNDNAYNETIKDFDDPFLTPSDSHYQYQHTMVGSTYAWNAGYTGAGIKIAILDTGVSPHTDLNIVHEYNFTTDSDAKDYQGHGTNVAGLAAAKNNNSTGGSGIAPGADIYNIKVLNSSGSAGDLADAARGINYAVSKNVDIINMSLGSYYYNNVEATAVKAAYEAGIVVIAAAGNDGSKIKCYPASYDETISIGAVNPDKGRTYFSNYGSWVDFSAPGANLWSTGISKNTQIDGSYYVEMSGTSQATPIFSGTAAVILSADESIRTKTGKARVDALIAKMKKGTIAGNGGAAGIVSLPKALGLSVSTAAPAVPVFENTDKIINNANSVNVSFKPSADTIYYSTDGKTPTYKNGVLSNGKRYTGAFPVGGAAKVTVKAIAINASGKASKAASITFTFKPLVSEVVITGPNAVLKGKSITLKAAVVPTYAANKKVTWSSSDAAITVKNGKVTATSSAEVGKTYTITAASNDGAAAGTFNVTVRETAKIKAVAFKDKDGKSQSKATVTWPGTNVTFDDLTKLINVTNADGSPGSIEDVDFTSSNVEVARIDSTTRGRVNIVGTGKAVITATANDGSGKKAAFTLTVQKEVTSLTIQGSDKLNIGKSIKLTAVVNSDAGNKKVKWSIHEEDKDKGVTVSNGTVKAAKTATAGTYRVIAEALDGSGLSDTQTITVYNNPITKITLDKKNATIFNRTGNYASSQTVTITPTITATSTSTAVEFTSSNPGIATVTWNGSVATVRATGNATGTTKITCKAIDGSGKSATCTVKVVNPASSLILTPQAGRSPYVAIGKTLKLSAVIEEEFGSISSKKIEWKSSDESIATVDKNGNVKGIKRVPNTELVTTPVTITATLNDGSAVTASYVIYVMDPIKSLKLYEYESGREYATGNVLHIFKLGYYYTPYIWINNHYSYSNRGNDCTFSSISVEVGNPDILIAAILTDDYKDSYLYMEPQKTGTTTVTLKAMDGSGVSVTYKIKVEK